MSKTIVTAEKPAKTNLTPKNLRGLQLLTGEGVVAVWADKNKYETFYTAVTTKRAGWNVKKRSDLQGPYSTAEVFIVLEGLKKRGAVAMERFQEALAAAFEAEAEMLEAERAQWELEDAERIEAEMTELDRLDPMTDERIDEMAAEQAQEPETVEIEHMTSYEIREAEMAVMDQAAATETPAPKPADPLLADLAAKAAARTAERNKELVAELAVEIPALRGKLPQLEGEAASKAKANLHRKSLMLVACAIAAGIEIPAQALAA